MRRTRLAVLLSLLALASLGGSCGGGSGSKGGGLVVKIESIDPRCAALANPFPPGLAFVPGIDARIVAAVLGTTPTLVPFDVASVPPRIADGVPILGIPLDSDGDDLLEGIDIPLSPILDGVVAVDPGFGLATASDYDEVIFFSPEGGRLLDVEILVPSEGFVARDNFFLPPPGVIDLRTGLSTLACVRPPPGAVDSRGDPIEDTLPAALFCDASMPSYDATFTSGVALAGDRLFVSASNVGEGAGGPATQYRPGSVLVYDLDRTQNPPRVGPNPDTPVIITTAFNPTQVTPYSVGGREFVLVTVSGAIGIEPDDPNTPEIEGGGIAIGESAIDVIDAGTLQLVATIPLGKAALSFDVLAIDPSGRVALTGSAAGRVLYGVDLAPLATLPDDVPSPIVLARDEAVLFDAAAPLRLPAIPDGAPPESCPGETVGVAFNHAGDRIYAADFCDGTLSIVGTDVDASFSTNELRDRFLVLDTIPVVAPIRADTLGKPRGMGSLVVRPGRPGVDFEGPDVFVLLGLEEGSLCGLRIESP
jgi:hypothetical protein